MRIGFFGCSFTEGGGMDSEEWYQYAIKNGIWEEDDYKQERIQSGGNPTYYRRLIRDRYRFSTLVGKKLNCEVENLAEDCNSNENIINQLYENIGKFDIFVVQFTISTRRHIWWEPDNKFHSIGGVDFLEHNTVAQPDSELIKTYKNFIVYHHNDEYEHKKLEMYVNLFESTGKEIYWMFHETIPINCKSKNVVYFEPPNGDYLANFKWEIGKGGHLQDFVKKNKLTFKDETKGFVNDTHYSIEGHKIIANKIVEKIND